MESPRFLSRFPLHGLSHELGFKWYIFHKTCNRKSMASKTLQRLMDVAPRGQIDPQVHRDSGISPQQATYFSVSD